MTSNKVKKSINKRTLDLVNYLLADRGVYTAPVKPKQAPKPVEKK